MTKGIKINLQKLNNEIESFKKSYLQHIEGKMRELRNIQQYLEENFSTEVQIAVDTFFNENERPQEIEITELLNLIKKYPQNDFIYDSDLFVVLRSLELGIKSFEAVRENSLEYKVNSIMTLTQAAEEAKVSKVYISQETYDISDKSLSFEEKDGKLPTISLGGKTKVVSKVDFEKWNEARKKRKKNKK